MRVEVTWCDEPTKTVKKMVTSFWAIDFTNKLDKHMKVVFYV